MTARPEHHHAPGLPIAQAKTRGDQLTLLAGQVPVPQLTRRDRNIQHVKQHRIPQPEPLAELSPQA